MRRYQTLIAALALLAAALSVKAAYPASVWTFDTPTDLTSNNGDVASAVGMQWSDGAWHVTGDPDLTWGMLVTMHSGQPGGVALVRSDQRIIGVHSDPAANFSWGAVDRNSWLIKPSPVDYRVVVQIPSSTLTLDSLWISNELVTPSPDVNYDGRVDIFDVNLVSANWGGGLVGDANADGMVDVFDINAISANWSAVAVVDEPETLALLIAGLAALVPVLRRLGAV